MTAHSTSNSKSWAVIARPHGRTQGCYARRHDPNGKIALTDMKSHRIAVTLAALGAAIFVFGGRIRAADVSFPIYFPDSKLIVKADVMNRTTYLPIKEIIGRMGLPYTDSVALETLTIRSGNNQLVVTKNSALISYNGQIILLPSPILREDSRWLAPIEFLTTGLSKMTPVEFRYRPGTFRLFVGNIEAPE